MLMNVSAQNPSDKYVLVIHGGAGTILKTNMTPEREAAYRTALEQALMAGYRALKDGGSAIDAVEKAICVMEDSPLFNAGKGSVFTNDGRNEMDASVMNGADKAAGAVAGITVVKNPIRAARAVMEKSGHVMLAGTGAESFARSVGLEIVSPEYFYTEDRWNGLQRVLRKDSLKTRLDHDEQKAGKGPFPDAKFGTVGAVALDSRGNLAAGTSTGGMTNKRFGRIGDSPIIGAGNYADSTVAVSCTGWGEHFIRNAVAFRVAAQMEFGGLSLKEAAERALAAVTATGGDGGLIAIDKSGNIAMPFTTAGMYRACITADGRISIQFYKD